MTWTVTNLIIQIIAGIAGGHAAAAAVHDHKFGALGHTIAGAAGGAVAVGCGVGGSRSVRQREPARARGRRGDRRRRRGGNHHACCGTVPERSWPEKARLTAVCRAPNEGRGSISGKSTISTGGLSLIAVPVRRPAAVLSLGEEHVPDVARGGRKPDPAGSSPGSLVDFVFVANR